MTVSTSIYTFASRFGGSPKRSPRSPNPTNTVKEKAMPHTFTICKSLDTKVRYNDSRYGRICQISGYNYILKDGKPLGWVEKNNPKSRCFPKALISYGIHRIGNKYCYIGSKGNKCYLEADGGTKKKSSGGFSPVDRLPIVGLFV